MNTESQPESKSSIETPNISGMLRFSVVDIREGDRLVQKDVQDPETGMPQDVYYYDDNGVTGYYAVPAVEQE